MLSKKWIFVGIASVFVSWQAVQYVQRSSTETDRVYDPYSIRNKKLIAMGERAYPYLMEDLLTTNNEYVISRALGIMSAGTGEKHTPRTAIKTLFYKWQTNNNQAEIVKISIAFAIGNIQCPDDLYMLYKFLEDAEIEVQAAALIGLQDAGDAGSLPHIDAYIQASEARELEKARKARELNTAGSYRVDSLLLSAREARSRTLARSALAIVRRSPPPPC